MRQAIETYVCDYKPFGELDGGDEPTKHGFATAEYDGESSCFAMGMRMYSAEIGRFLSVDPLFEAMPRHTPYHYSFNSPLVWKDPSGLIPENEKDQDRLMTLEPDPDGLIAAEAYHKTLVENNFQRMSVWATAVESMWGIVVKWNDAIAAREGGGGDGDSQSRLGSLGRGNNGIGFGNNFLSQIFKGINQFFNFNSALIGSASDETDDETLGNNSPSFTTGELLVEANREPIIQDPSINSLPPINFLIESVPDFTFATFEEYLRNISIGDNGKVYYKTLVDGRRPFHGNQNTKVVMGKTIGKIEGTATYILTLGNEINAVSNNEISLGRFGLDLTAYTTAFMVGGYPGFVIGLVYEGYMYEYFDSRFNYDTYPTGNNNHMPSDNTKVRKIIK